jgi:hypothetical protein
MLSCRSASAQDPITLIIQEGVTKVIQAVDLKIQRLQNRTLWLQGAQKVLENEMSRQKLEDITDWVEKQRALYAAYFQELWEIKADLHHYSEVRRLTEGGWRIVQQYRRGWLGALRDPHFTAKERVHIQGVLTRMVEESVRVLEEVEQLLRPGVLQMEDGERLALLREAGNAMETLYSDAVRFNEENLRLSLSRARSAGEVERVKQLYGLKK